MKIIGKKDHPGIRRPPQVWIARAEPGKYSGTVGKKKPVNREITAKSQQAVFIRLIRMGKPKVSCQQHWKHGT